MGRQIKTNDLATGALRTWVEVTREINARENWTLTESRVRDIGVKAIRRLRDTIETEAAVNSRAINEDDWRV